MVDVNYLNVLISAVLAMVLGTVWYGFLFKKQWMEIIGVSGLTEEEQKMKQRESMRLYFIQFVLVIMQAYVVTFYVKGFGTMIGIENALLLWFAFVMPTLAGSSMWTNDSRRISLMRFFIQLGYQFLMFVVFGFILSM